MDTNYMSLILASSDTMSISSGATASRFIAYLPVPVTLPGRWEACWASISGPAPMAQPRSVFAYLDILDEMPVGASLLPLLCRVGPIQTGTTFAFTQTSTILPWRQVSARTINQIQVTLSDSTGMDLPNSFPTIIELVLRQVSST
jgi:hypothetical protein